LARVAPWLLFRAALAVLIVVAPLLIQIVSIYQFKYPHWPIGFLQGVKYYFTDVDLIDEGLLVLTLIVFGATVFGGAILVWNYSRDLILKFLESARISLDDLIINLSSTDIEAAKNLKLAMDDWWQRHN